MSVTNRLPMQNCKGKFKTKCMCDSYRADSVDKWTLSARLGVPMPKSISPFPLILCFPALKIEKSLKRTVLCKS